jgi:hypothetical protein
VSRFTNESVFDFFSHITSSCACFAAKHWLEEKLGIINPGKLDEAVMFFALNLGDT